ncbi:DegT/DnrJ/EryC1/StrS family aminotransferase [Staphylococcus felis]|uniref:DegT/DnrJ/EryC1/StrS family aminotransferase n=1 Tax=Staphylococcus felis TaxID=46127 RepID=UPI003966D0FD
MLSNQTKKLNKIPFLKPYLPNYDKIHIKFEECLNSGQLSKGKWLKKYEAILESDMEVKNVIGVSSGTIGLILALKALKIGSGDEVIVPSFTFCSTVHAIKIVGAKPVFADCKITDFTIDESILESKITSKTKAILAVHIFGVPAAVEEIKKISEKYSLKVVYDAAHAMGTKYKNIPIGQYGDISVYSTSPTKTLVTGEGGIIVTKHDDIAKQIRLLIEYGNPGDYNCTEIGINGRLSELSSIVGYESFKILKDNLKLRTHKANLYYKHLETIEGIELQRFSKEIIDSTYKDFSIVVKKEFGINRDQLSNILNKLGIPTKKYFYPAIHKMYAYKEYNDIYLPNTEYLSKNILSLPIYAELDDEIILDIVRIIKDIKNNKGKYLNY